MSYIKLSEISTKAPAGITEEEADKEMEDITKEIEDYQEKLYAEGKQSLLVVLQGMDSSGKDSATKKAFKECSPIGLSAYSFKKPSEEEMKHDFLWRVHKHAPEKGEIQVFLRSHYEDILVQRVHHWIDDTRAAMRMEAINAWEKLLQFDNNTTILKCYLHLSKEQQEIELMQRIDEEKKHWKHNDGDWGERAYWNKYMEYYEYAINNSVIPWEIIPVDDRWYKNYAIAKKILETLKKMNPQFPPLDTEREEWKK